MNLSAKIASLLFVAGRPLSVKKIAETVEASEGDVRLALDELKSSMNQAASGIQLLEHGSAVQFVTNSEAGSMVTAYLKEEQAGELSKPALETLTIIAYRGPISKIQLDTIRGVNCSLILRNLMIKGLVESIDHKQKLQTSYQVTSDFVRFLGLNHISELPDYESLHSDERLESLLNPAPTVAVAEEPSAPPTSPETT